MRTLFFGTPDIAVPALRALHQCGDLVAVVCQPDRRAGRGLALKAPAVKQCAAELDVPCHQPEQVRCRQMLAWVEAQRPDAIVVMAYGRILGPRLLAAPPRGCLNLHASLLPRYRGAAPINWAIAHGDRESGIALMHMAAGCDTGPVYCRRAIPIGPDETAGELSDRLAALAARVVLEDLPAALAGELVPEPQDENAATLAPMLKKEDGRIDWTQPAARVHNHARGMTPWPGAHTLCRDKRLKVLATRLGSADSSQPPAGTVLAVEAQGALVACGSGSVWVLRAQLAGKRPLSPIELQRGRALGPGDRLGSS